MEQLKGLAEIQEPDSRHQAFVKIDRESGQFVSMRLEDYYQWISTINLKSTVPEDIQGYFETVKNVFLYGWFVYPFYAIATFLSDTAVEMALRRRFQREDPRGKWSLRKLLKEACVRRLIRDEGFPSVQRQREYLAAGAADPEDAHSEPGDYTSILTDSLPRLRNSFAHPKSQTILVPGQAAATLTVASEVINQLF